MRWSIIQQQVIPYCDMNYYLKWNCLKMWGSWPLEVTGLDKTHYHVYILKYIFRNRSVTHDTGTYFNPRLSAPWKNKIITSLELKVHRIGNFLNLKFDTRRQTLLELRTNPLDQCQSKDILSLYKIDLCFSCAVTTKFIISPYEMSIARIYHLQWNRSI